jgi:hypothetical protein
MLRFVFLLFLPCLPLKGEDGDGPSGRFKHADTSNDEVIPVQPL